MSTSSSTQVTKILFWQRLFWLLLIVFFISSFVRIFRMWESVLYEFSEGNFNYLLIAVTQTAILVFLLLFILRLRKTIHLGQAYVATNSRENFTYWANEMRQAWVYFGAVIGLTVVQLLWTALIYRAGIFSFT